MTAEWIDGVRLSDRDSIVQLVGPDQSRPPTSSSPAPLKGGTKWVMETMVELFAAQIFRWGWVHCDPHPGNVLIRANPGEPTRPQLVLLDHGLYVRLSPNFKRQYAELWKGLLAADLPVITRVSKEWGIGAPDLFATATLLRPVRFRTADADTNEPGEELSQYEMSVRMKARLKDFLLDTDKMPKELIFIGRNMRCVSSSAFRPSSVWLTRRD